MRRLALALVLVFGAPLAGAHTMMMTQVLVSFGEARTVDVKIDIDLTLLLGSPDRYYEIATEAPEKQQQDIAALLPRIVDNLQLLVGQQR